ncbi:hypothetical protein KSB_29380 [Ktedonobacter robiniae]|uniref:Uncharacterized protein n=1 Tax=Ktedonobacter robiniae TaxID=2778365 RepID=A0ABQ3UP28_9CHLR|nr:hypothetical protein KSB_29380 [Ktedonobacter robiniae]
MTPECYQKLETLRLSVGTIKAALETAEVQKTKADHIKFMNIVRKELKALCHIIEYIGADLNAQATEKTSIEEPKREAAPPSSFWSAIFKSLFRSLS